MNSSDILEELRGAREELLGKAEGVPEPTLRTRPSAARSVPRSAFLQGDFSAGCERSQLGAAPRTR